MIGKGLLMREKAPLVFIYSGGKLPGYANYAMSFAAMHSGLKIIMLCDDVPRKKVPNIEYTEISDFYNHPCYMKDFDPPDSSEGNKIGVETSELNSKIHF